MDTGDDCRFFYNTVCAKGDACTYRHVAEAKKSEVTCENWRLGRCMVKQCPYRHSELQIPHPCYYENQPGGCTKPHCQYLHKFPRAAPPPAATDPGALPITIAPPSQSSVIIQPHPPVSAPMQGGWNGPPPQRHIGPPPQGHTGPPPRHNGPPPQRLTGPSPPGMWHPGRPAVPGFYPRPGVPVPQHIRPGFPPTSAPFPAVPDQHFYPPHHHPGQISQVQPIIINPNEESDIENSPVKPANRTVAPPVQQPPRVDNPLDYFLNAKPFVPVDHNPPQPRPLLRSPSPTNPSQRHGSLSPVRRSPRRSLSPANTRRRSTSEERHDDNRRRSNSADRLRSPERGRDTRRFGRRSPPRRRSRSPIGGSRNPGVLNRYRAGDKYRGQPQLPEVKVSGRKIVSLKKDKKEEEDEQKEKKIEKTEDEKTDKTEKPKEKEIDSAQVVKEEVKSLEEIYRERALLSMMEAKRKRILESKRKRWEGVKGSETSKSESEKSDKSDDKPEDPLPNPVPTEKGDNSTHDESSSETGEDEAGSELDFGEDVDIELGEGEIEEEGQKEEQEAESEEEKQEDERKPVLKKKESKREKGKLSIKSRLGLRALEDVTKQSTTTNKKGSIKDRLGIKTTDPDSDKPLRSGVIKLNRGSKSDDIFSRIQKSRESRNRENSKNVLVLPQITIKNNAEDRKLDIKQRLGLLDSKDSKKRKKKDIDNELVKLLSEEDIDIDFDDLELLSKKEKKKLLKKLLVQQGREDEYYEITSKKRKKHGRRKEYLDEEGEHGRRVKVKDRKEKIEEQSEGDELHTEEEIEFGEEDVESKENTEEQHEVEEDEVDAEVDDKDAAADERVPSPSLTRKTEEEIQQEKAEKEAKLREALEPKSLADIRRERAIKRATGESTVISIGQNRRKIVVAEDEPPVEKSDPLVKVTFGGIRENKRKLVRIGRSTPEPADNIQITTGRTARKERQIYIPPTAKKTESDTSVTSKKPSDISSGREIIDYGDMFVSKSASAPDVAAKKSVKITSRLTPVESQTLKISRGPPKVEVKDATVKTFAEIMAEKKRKRLEAQQAANKKPFTPISLDDPESSSSPKSFTMDTSSQPASVTSSPVKSQLKTLNLKKSASQTNITQDNKPKRWKRQRLSEQSTSDQNTATNPTEDKPNTVNVDLKPTVANIDTFNATSAATFQATESKVETTKSSVPSVQSSVIKHSKIESPPKQKEDVSEPKPVISEVIVSPHISASKRRVLDEQPTTISGSAEKKAKFSDSLLDFEDDLLDLDDDELELNDDQDHDQLMKELEELL